MSDIKLADKYFTNKDYDKAINIWQQLPGNYRIFDRLGWCYYKGKGVNIDYKKAFEYYSKSFNICNTIYTGLIIINMYNNSDITFNIDEIMKIYSKLEILDKSNSAWSGILNNIGISYYIISNNEKEYYWYTKSYDLDKNVCNTLNIAECHRYGVGTVVNHKKALEYYNEYLSMDDEDGDITVQDANKVKSVVDSYEMHGTTDYENSIKIKIELITGLLIVIPKELGQIIGKYMYIDLKILSRDYFKE